MSDDQRTPEEIEADAAPDNAGNPVAVKRKRVTSKDRAARENEALHTLLEDDKGRLLLRTFIFLFCGVDDEIANAQYDANGMHYKAGARAAGMLIRNRCASANMPGFLRMVQEEYLEKTK